MSDGGTGLKSAKELAQCGSYASTANCTEDNKLCGAYVIFGLDVYIVYFCKDPQIPWCMIHQLQ